MSQEEADSGRCRCLDTVHVCVCVRERETEKRQRERRCVCVGGVRRWCMWVACVNSRYSLLHFQCHFFILYFQSMILFSKSLLPRSVEKRPKRLRLEIEIKWHSKCNNRYHQSSRSLYCVYVRKRVRVCVRKMKRERALACARTTELHSVCCMEEADVTRRIH